MRNLLLKISVLIMMMSGIVYSQTFNLSDIDASNFPKLGASYSAYTALGNPITNFAKKDFIIEDNGYLVPEADFEINCTAKLPLSVVLVLDKSGSMTDLVNGERPWDWVVEGAKSFINNIVLTDDSQIAVVAFASDARLVINFTNNKAEIIDSIMKIEKSWGIYGSTNFNKGFLNETNGAINLIKDAPVDHRRVIVFLTDGNHEVQTEPLNTPGIIEALKSNNIYLYAINLLTPKNKDLKYIAETSNGKFFETFTKDQLNNIYKNVADDASVKVQCHLYWNVPPVCDEAARFRTVTVTYTNSFPILSQTKNYIVTNEDLAKIDFEPPLVDFGDPPGGGSSEETFKLKAVNYDFKIKDFRISPPGSFEILDWGDGKGIKPSGDVVLQKDQEITMKVVFNQMNPKRFKQATLILDAYPCTQEVLLIGGRQQIEIDNPINSQAFAQCDTVKIQWSGVEPNYEVNLSYSANQGANWVPIANKVKGLKYNWISPNILGTLQIKAEVADMSFWEWAIAAGNSGIDSSKSVAVDYNDMFVYICGSFSGTGVFPGNNKVTSFGKQDFYLAKFDVEGNLIWVRSGGSELGNDIANGVALDPAGNVYIVGTAYKGIKFGSFTVGLEYDNTPYFFVAKYSNSGDYIRSTFLGATAVFEFFQATGVKLKYFLDKKPGSFPRIYAQGFYKGKYTDYFNDFQLPSTTKWEVFTAVYDLNLNIKDLQFGAIDQDNYSTNVAYDSEGRKYQTGQFTNTINFDGINVTGFGESDIYLAKNSKIPITSDTVIDVLLAKPMLTVTTEMNPLKFDDVTVGEEIETTMPFLITNNEKIPFTITNYSFTGAFKDDWSLVEDIKGKVLQPGDSIDLVFKFKPLNLGQRNASLIINGYCASATEIPVSANGVCGGLSAVLYDFGDVNLGKAKSDIIDCAFKNNSNVPVYISIQHSPSYNYQDFNIDSLSIPRINSRYYVMPDSCANIYITFTPKDFGERKHEIFFVVYNVKGEQCNKIPLAIIGNCLTSDVRVSNFNWYEKRTNGKYTSKISVKNESNVIDTIKAIYWNDPSNPSNDNIFKFENLNLPILLDQQSEVTLNVEFNPKDEIYYSSQIKFEFAIKPEPLISTLEGTGILPKMSYEFKCDGEVKVGEKADVLLTVFNNSSSSDLKIKSIDVFNSVEYRWKTTAPADLTIPKSDKQEFLLEYEPIESASHVVNFRILADDFDGSFNEEWKTTEFTRSCNSVSLDFPTKVDFQNVMVCDKDEINATIKNTSNVAITLFLQNATISGADKDDFTIVDNAEVVLYSGLPKDIKFAFKPSKAKTIHNATATIPNSAGIDIKIDLVGFGSTFTTSAEPATINKYPGDKFTLSAFANLPKLTSGEINAVKVKILFNDTVIYPYKDSFKSKISAQAGQANYMIWGSPVFSKGQILVEGNGKLTASQSLEIFSIDFLTLLNEQGSSQIRFEIDYGCFNESFSVTTVNIDSVCANDTRIIVASGIPFALISPNPNPVSSSAEIQYSIAFETDVKLVIYNATGEIVKTIVDKRIPAGYYSSIIDSHDISNGIYFIKIEAGPFTKSQSIIISR